MTKKERRIAILKDAIKQIKLEKIIADPGTVINVPDNILHKYSGQDDMKPILSEYFKRAKDEDNQCFACARGSLLMCTIHKENDFKLANIEDCYGSFNETSVTDKRLLRLFSKTQLLMMENAFEVEDTNPDLTLEEFKEEDEYGDTKYDKEEYYGLNCDKLSKKLSRKSVEFGLKYEDPNKRLIGIFSNAVRNGGIFTP